MGRPPKPRDKKMSRVVGVKVTEAELKTLRTEAKKRGTSVSGLLMEPWRKA